MKNLIRKILKEGEDDFTWANDIVSGQELPFRIVGPTKPPPMKRNLFVVKSEWMSGDADSYNNETDNFRSDKSESFEWFIHVCKVYKVLLNDRWGYHDWEDLNRLLNPLGYYTRRSKDKSGIEMSDFIKRDVFSDGEYPARLESIDIKYYDDNGIENDVRLI